MALTNLEIQAVKNALDYGNLTALALPYIDTALAFEVVVQQNLDAYGEQYIRATILPALVAIETAIADPARLTSAGIKELVGDVVFDTSGTADHLASLTSKREFWIDRLSATVRIPRAVRAGGGRQGGSIEVY